MKEKQRNGRKKEKVKAGKKRTKTERRGKEEVQSKSKVTWYTRAQDATRACQRAVVWGRAGHLYGT